MHVHFRLRINGAKNRSTVFPVPRIHIIKSRYDMCDCVIVDIVIHIFYCTICRERVCRYKKRPTHEGIFSITGGFPCILLLLLLSLLLLHIGFSSQNCIYDRLRTSATMTNIIEDFIYTYDTPIIVYLFFIV